MEDIVTTKIEPPTFLILDRSINMFSTETLCNDFSAKNEVALPELKFSHLRSISINLEIFKGSLAELDLVWHGAKNN